MSNRLFLVWMGFFLFTGEASAQQNLMEQFRILNDPLKEVFRPEGNGIRVATPTSKRVQVLKEPPPFHWIMDSQFQLGGDFEILVDFEVKQIGPEDGPLTAEGNAEISLQGPGGRSIYGINVYGGPDSPSSFRVVRMEPNAGGAHFQFLSFPRKSQKGRMGFRREGSQIVFLAADGAGEPLIELVRFPYLLSLEPYLRISAFQGNDKARTRVDVLFCEIAMKAEKWVSRNGPTEILSLASMAANFPVNLNLGKSPRRALTELKKGSDSGQAFQVEGNHLRVKPPLGSQYTKGAQAFWHRESDWSMEGDFEISLNYDVEKAEPAGPEGYGSVSLGFSLESYGPLGSVTFGRGASRDKGHQFTIVRHSPTSTGGSWDTRSFKTESRDGGLILRRQGERFYFLVKEGQGEPREIFQCPAILTPVKLRLSADQGANNTSALDVVISDLVIKAQVLLQNGEPVKKAVGESSSIPNLDEKPELPDPPPSRRWLFPLLGLGILLGIVIAIILALRNRKTKSTP